MKKNNFDTKKSPVLHRIKNPVVESIFTSLRNYLPSGFSLTTIIVVIQTDLHKKKVIFSTIEKYQKK